LVNNVAQWDGFSWHPLALGTSDSGFPDLGGPPSVSALALSGGTLYMGGNFTWVTNASGPVLANSIARWDGASWSPLGSGMSGYEPFTAVRALGVSSDGNLSLCDFIASGWPDDLGAFACSFRTCRVGRNLDCPLNGRVEAADRPKAAVL